MRQGVSFEVYEGIYSQRGKIFFNDLRVKIGNSWAKGWPFFGMQYTIILHVSTDKPTNGWQLFGLSRNYCWESQLGTDQSSPINFSLLCHQIAA